MILSIQEAVDEFTSRFVHHVGRAPNDQDMEGAVKRFNTKYLLQQGVGSSDFEAFCASEQLPPVPVAVPVPAVIFVPEAQGILQEMWKAATGKDMTPQQWTAGLQHYGATSGQPIDKADFMLWAEWWIARETK